MKKWGGHKARVWTATVLANKGRLCALQLEGCTRVATTGDHIIPRSVRPDLQYDPRNGRPACLPCNQKRGTRDLGDARLVVDTRHLFESSTTPGMDSAGSPPRDSAKTGGTR